MRLVGSFFAGIADLLRGFGWWRHRPGLMAAGLVPAVIVAGALAALFIALGLTIDDLVIAVTPFADGWDPVWAVAVRVTLGTAVVAASVLLSIMTFTALTLTVGDPFYERIWRAVEADAGGEIPGGAGFWRAAGSSATLIALGALNALVVLLAGLIPVAGSVLAGVCGVVLGGRLLGRELTGRAFDARNLSGADRKAVLRGHRARMLGFGIATQLLFLVPLGAILTMPAAVAGSTILARRALQDRAADLA